MSGEIDKSPQLSEADIAELVQGIDREHIVRLVKQQEYLQRRVFAGFRPTHLPWRQVPKKLAQDAAGHPDRVDHLFNLWIHSNQDLLDEVSHLSVENLREGVVELLVRRGLEERKQILWALYIDRRPEVEQALEDGLERELVEEASVLISQAEANILAEALEIARERLAEAEAGRNVAEAEVEKLQRLAQRRADEIQRRRASYDVVAAEKTQLEEEVATLKEQRRSDQQTIMNLQRQLAEEQERVQELRRSVKDLRSSLQAQSEDRDLDEALLELEEERQNSARLRLKVESLTHDLRQAYEKRDGVRQKVESLEQEVQRLNHDKRVIIEEKRRLQERMEGLQTQVKNLRMRQSEQASERLMAAIPIEDLESAWQQAREDVRDHIHRVRAVLGTDPQSTVALDKNALWQDLVGRELSLVGEGLADLDTYPETGKLPETVTFRKAQKLLALRWYLLEYTRQAVQYAEMTSFSV